MSETQTFCSWFLVLFFFNVRILWLWFLYRIAYRYMCVDTFWFGLRALPVIKTFTRCRYFFFSRNVIFFWQASARRRSVVSLNCKNRMFRFYSTETASSDVLIIISPSCTRLLRVQCGNTDFYHCTVALFTDIWARGTPSSVLSPLSLAMT